MIKSCHVFQTKAMPAKSQSIKGSMEIRPGIGIARAEEKK